MNFIFFRAGQRFSRAVIGIFPNFRAGGLCENFLATIGMGRSNTIFFILLMWCKGVRFNRTAFASPMGMIRLNTIFLTNFADIIPDHIILLC